MRPDIARLLTPHIYSELENHASVLEYENIKVGFFMIKIFIVHRQLKQYQVPVISLILAKPFVSTCREFFQTFFSSTTRSTRRK